MLLLSRTVPDLWQSKCILPNSRRVPILFFWKAYLPTESTLNGKSAHPAGFSDLKPVTAKSRLLDEHADFSSAAAELYAAANYVSDVIAFSYVREEA